MRECDNADMRDRLPVLLHDTGEAGLSEVRAHVAQCAPCRAELELLQAVRAATPAPAVDVERIAAAIGPYAPRSSWRIVASSAAFRIAAGVVLVVGLGTLVSDAGTRRGADTAALPVAATPPGELPVGTPLGELTDEDLRDLLRSLGELEPGISTESDVIVVPALERSGA